jgi:hypothetical protein
VGGAQGPEKVNCPESRKIPNTRMP